MKVIFSAVANCGEFSLGLTSFSWLDSHNIFDKYQESHDELSECVFSTSAENVKQLSIDIICVAYQDSRIREDIKLRLVKFAQFIIDSGGVSAIIE